MEKELGGGEKSSGASLPGVYILNCEGDYLEDP